MRKDKHLEQNIGKEVIVHLFKVINNQKQIEGTLNKFDDNIICIKHNEEIIEIERKNIALIKTKFEW